MASNAELLKSIQMAAIRLAAPGVVGNVDNLTLKELDLVLWQEVNYWEDDGE